MNSDLFNYWLPASGSRDRFGSGLRSFNLNFGPQHPASHGVLSIVVQLSGEIIERADTHIGLLHRGTEKLLEERPYHLGLPYFDSLDYTSILIQEHAYCLGIEDLMGSSNYLANFAKVRVVFDELTRILNHLIALSTHAMDVGTMAVFFWGFEERERIMEFYERVSGASMHAAFYRPNETSIGYVSSGLVNDILFFCRDLFNRLAQIEYKLNSSNIWSLRLAEVGVLLPQMAQSWGASGVLASSSGLRRDLRINYGETYGSYNYLMVSSFLGGQGDCYDRFLIRMREMAESAHLVLQIVSQWSLGEVGEYSGVLDMMSGSESKVFSNSHSSQWGTGMEELIGHFKHYSEGYPVPRGLVYSAVESAKGEFGVFLVSDGSTSPYSCRIRSPAYIHTQMFAPMSQGHYFADLVTIIGSQDIVMGEVDS